MTNSLCCFYFVELTFKEICLVDEVSPALGSVESEEEGTVVPAFSSVSLKRCRVYSTQRQQEGIPSSIRLAQIQAYHRVLSWKSARTYLGLPKSLVDSLFCVETPPAGWNVVCYRWIRFVCKKSANKLINNFTIPIRVPMADLG